MNKYFKLQAKTETAAILEGKNLCSCYQKSYVGVKWRDVNNNVHEWTWGELYRKVNEM